MDRYHSGRPRRSRHRRGRKRGGSGNTPGRRPGGGPSSGGEDTFERHLPKLTATGVVEYDRMRGPLTLSTTQIADRVS